MEQNDRLRPLPKKLLFSGEKRFRGDLSDPFQTWILEPGHRPGSGPLIRSWNSSHPGGFVISPIFNEVPRGRETEGSSPAPRLINFSEDWVEYSYAPQEGLQVDALNWTPDVRVVCGSLQLSNHSIQDREISLTTLCQTPRGQGWTRLGSAQFHGREILAGTNRNLAVGFFLSGGRSGETSAGLTSQLSLPAGKRQEVRWIFASGGSHQQVLEYLEAVIEMDWAGKVARLKVRQAGRLQIQTGDTGWDLALALSRKQARLITRQLSLQAMESPSARHCISPLQAWQLSQALLPLTSGEFAQLLSLLSTEGDRPAAGGSHTEKHLPSLPLAAELLWQMHRAGCPTDLWVKYLPWAEAQLQEWFERGRDRDGDGVPALAGPNPYDLHSDRPAPGSSLAAIRAGSSLEHPGLASLLLNEIHRLGELFMISQGKDTGKPWLEEQGKLAAFIQESWFPAQHRFRTRDSLTHLTAGEFTLSRYLKEGWNTLDEDLPQPSRLILYIQKLPEGDHPPQIQIILHGLDWQGRHRVEEISPPLISWEGREGWAVTGPIYSHLTYCRVAGPSDQARVQVLGTSSDVDDISLLLTLWNPDLPTPERNDLIEHSLANLGEYLSRYGLKSFPDKTAKAVQLPWNLLIARALLRLGRKMLVANLFSRWMDASLINIRQTGNTFPDWDCQTGQGWGKENWIESLLPTTILLDLAGLTFQADGVLVWEPQQDLIRDLRLSYRGIQIEVCADQLTITRSGGERQLISGKGKQKIQLFRSSSENSST